MSGMTDDEMRVIVQDAIATMKEANEKLAALRAENDKLREALKPFARDKQLLESDLTDEADYFSDTITLGDVRRVAALLKKP